MVLRAATVLQSLDGNRSKSLNPRQRARQFRLRSRDACVEVSEHDDSRLPLKLVLAVLASTFPVTANSQLRQYRSLPEKLCRHVSPRIPLDRGDSGSSSG